MQSPPAKLPVPSPAPPPRRDAPRRALAQTLLALPAGSAPAEDWRAAAAVLLRVAAGEVDALVVAFEAPTTREETRAAVLELLAGAGTPEAQAAMRRCLSSHLARRSSVVFADLVQRLGRIAAPEPATLRYLETVYGEARTESEGVRAACAYALGASAGNARQAGEEAGAVAATEPLRHDLLEARTTGWRRVLVLALGNAGLTVDLAAIVGAAADSEPTVRAAAAVALRCLDARGARGQLLTMLADVDPRVAEGALAALAMHALDEGELERLATSVIEGATAPALDAGLLRLLTTQATEVKAARLRSARRTNPIEAALRILLGRAEAPLMTSSSPPPPMSPTSSPGKGKLVTGIVTRIGLAVPEELRGEAHDERDAPSTLRRPEAAEALFSAVEPQFGSTSLKPPMSPEQLRREAEAALPPVPAPAP